jgi:hypothetical protein
MAGIKITFLASFDEEAKKNILHLNGNYQRKGCDYTTAQLLFKSGEFEVERDRLKLRQIEQKKVAMQKEEKREGEISVILHGSSSDSYAGRFFIKQAHSEEADPGTNVSAECLARFFLNNFYDEHAQPLFKTLNLYVCHGKFSAFRLSFFLPGVSVVCFDKAINIDKEGRPRAFSYERDAEGKHPPELTTRVLTLFTDKFAALPTLKTKIQTHLGEEEISFQQEGQNLWQEFQQEMENHPKNRHIKVLHKNGNGGFFPAYRAADEGGDAGNNNLQRQEENNSPSPAAAVESAQI